MTAKTVISCSFTALQEQNVSSSGFGPAFASKHNALRYEENTPEA